MIYGTRSNGNNHGQVLTKPLVVEKMLDLVGYLAPIDLSKLRIIEPSSGDGAFAVIIMHRLYASSLAYGFNFQEALSNITLYEIDPVMVDLLAVRIDEALKPLSAIRPESMIRCEDYLLCTSAPCDIVIGNPPYVRHENIPEEKKVVYRKLFRTFTHRSDLYIAFFEKGLKQLKPNGKLSFITSNRWLKNQYGKNLRDLIGSNYKLNEVIDLEGTNPFEEEVLAYPAITTITKAYGGEIPGYYQISDLRELENFSTTNTPSRTLNIRASNWFATANSGEKHEQNLDTILHQGFKIGIGVATGCDRVFIHKDFTELIEKELLLPILMSKDLRGDKLEWGGNYILNPFGANGELIDLEKFPKANAYMLSHKDILNKRHITKKNQKNWYKTIDKIQRDLTFRDKIILPDMSGNTSIFIDKGEFYPHHNLYYITGKNKKQLTLLAALLMSDFVKDQLLEYGNKMNGGYARWQSQNLKKLQVPIIDSIPSDTAFRLIHAYENHNIGEINKLITPSRISEYELTVGQASLFEPEQKY
ncbi:MAG: Eco57I restriction-modification methylase domain-containing protein [Bacteroidota bacterium]